VSEPVRDREIDRPRAGWWRCIECLFRRYFATDKGALSGAARHMKERHGVRVTLPTRHHPGMVHGRAS